MRIEHISFSGQGPLSGFSTSFKPVSLIIGDNERGKSVLLDGIAEALFAKSPARVRFTGRPFTERGDAYRLKNVLYFTGAELKGVADWDEELRGLLYGRDKVSLELRQNFLKNMGVDASQPWLHSLHKELLDFKQTLGEALGCAALEETKDTDSQNKICHAEEEKDDLFPLMVKMRLGQEYLNLFDEQAKAQKALETGKKRLDPSEAEGLGKEIAALERDIRKKRERLEAWERGAPLSPWERFRLFSGNLISFVFGCVTLGISFLLVWFGRHMPHTHPSKLGALALFAIAAFLLLKTVFAEMNRAEGSGRPYNEGKAGFMESEHRRLVQMEESLYAKRTAYRKMIDGLRRNGYQDETPEHSRRCEELSRSLRAQEEKILPLYHSCDPNLIQEEITLGEERLRRSDLLEYYRAHENPAPAPAPPDTRPFSAFIESLRALKETAKNPRIGGRYSEILSWDNGTSLASLRGIEGELEPLLDKLAKDRDKAEKLVKTYKELSGGSEELLFRVFQSGDFRRLIQMLFGGKYKTFDLGIDGEGRFRIRARTGNDALIPVESLSDAAALQFYFAVKLALAQELMDEEEGILLLDESFSLFDTLRARCFIDILGVFAEGGWQIVYAMKDDKLVYDTFREKFGDVSVINLNRGP